jgi:hypothetical protein
VTNVQQQKLLFSQRWKHRRAPRLKAVVAFAPTAKPIALMPSPAPIPTAEPLTAADRARIVRWVASRIICWPPDNCIHCKRPIVTARSGSSLSTTMSGLVFTPIAHRCGGRSRRGRRERRWGCPSSSEAQRRSHHRHDPSPRLETMDLPWESGELF